MTPVVFSCVLKYKTRWWCWTQVRVPDAQWVPNTNWNVRVWSRDRLTAGSNKENRRLMLKKTPNSLMVFEEFLQAALGVRTAGGVIFFWLVGGEVTRQRARNRVPSLKLPTSTRVGALGPAKELIDTVMHIPGEGPRLCSIIALLFLNYFSFVSSFSPFPN